MLSVFLWSKSQSRPQQRSAGGQTPAQPPLSALCWLSPDVNTEPLLTLQVFADATIVEVFANGGRVAMATRVYPHNTDGTLALLVEGCDLTLERAEAYAMGPSG